MKFNLLKSLVSLTIILSLSCDKITQEKIERKPQENKEQVKVINYSGGEKIIKDGDNEYSQVILDDTEYFGKFSFKDTIYQSVYSSQNYETFYALYAKATTDEIGLLKSIDLRIINYKGHINIGFTKSTLADNQLKLDTTILNLELAVKGMSNYNHLKIKIPAENKIYVDSIKQFNVMRKLVPLNGKEPVENDLSYCYVNNIFDNEFYYRSGLDYDIRAARPGQYNHQIHLASGKNCHQSKNLTK